jgi:hypothetical protein
MIKTPVTSCPTCCKVIDAATGLNAKFPEPGNLSVCVGCGTMLQYDEGLALKKLNEEQLAVIKAYDPSIHQVLVGISNHFKQQRALKN